MADEIEQNPPESGGKRVVPLRDHPVRIRKRNSKIFNDDEDTSFAYGRSPRKNRLIQAANAVKPNKPGEPPGSSSVPLSIVKEEKPDHVDIGNILTMESLTTTQPKAVRSRPHPMPRTKARPIPRPIPRSVPRTVPRNISKVVPRPIAVKSAPPRPGQRYSRPPQRHPPRRIPRMSSPPQMIDSPPPDSPPRQVGPSPMRLAAQRTSTRLRNILKLPKAHKWVCYEWFYSNIDQPLFLGDNEFCACLKESFPYLKTRKLTRVEWSCIRRLMGKPRRCSPAFLAEEIAALHSKRQKIRQLQQRKVVNLTHFRDLPKDVPLQLVIGTKVTALLRKPQDGLFIGSIDAVDTSNNTYRVTLERPGLGTVSIADHEVLSNEPQELMPISAFAQKTRRRNPFLVQPSRFLMNSPTLDNDPLLGSNTGRNNLLSSEEGKLGGFPVKFLVLLVRLSKILTAKREKLDELKEMNTEAEKLRSYQLSIPLDFQKKYAANVLEFECMNKDLNEYLTNAQRYCAEICPDQEMMTVVQPDSVRQRALNESRDLVEDQITRNFPQVNNNRMINLITELTSIMIQFKCLADNEMNSFEFKSLSDTLKEIQSKLEPQNVSVFQNSVEIHVKHIEAGLSQMGNLSAFAANTPI